MNILQANMHRCKAADALLSQMVMENDYEIIIISEQYKKKERGTWLEDSSSTAAIWLPPGSNATTVNNGNGNGFVWAKCDLFTVISCYLTPSDSIQEFQEKLDNIEDTARSIEGQLIIAGDLNSRAVEWGMPNTDSRGKRILEMAARLGLIVLNTGNATTFRRPGCEETTPDITLSTERMAGSIKNWKVLEDYTGSDHHYISFMIDTGTNANQHRKNTGTRKWNISKLDTSKLISAIDDQNPSSNSPIIARKTVEHTMLNITRACQKSMPKASHSKHKAAVYWWTENIAQLRRTCLRLRRSYTRSRRRGAAPQEAEQYKAAKKELKHAIDDSKKKKWEELREDINRNPWGLGYKIVMKKLGARAKPPDLTAAKMDHIVNALFPTHEKRASDPEQTLRSAQIPQFTLEELQLATGKLKANKSPGPDGIPAEILKIIAAERPAVLLNMYNACLEAGIFPEPWKKQRLVLISKGKGDPNSPSAYRPLCMLDTAGKLYESLLKPRLEAAINEAGGLSPRQHGFRPGRSTIGAIKCVIESVEAAQRRWHKYKRIVLLATLDVRNAFNSARWVDMIDALEKSFKIPDYLRAVVRSYLSNRKLLYETKEGSRQIAVTSGAAQGSILGPDLWNISYDAILKLEMPDESYLIGYADDIAAVITARDTEEARRKLNQVMIRTQAWLDSHNLQLATEKTELLLLTNKHIPLEISMHTTTDILRTKKAVNYLGVRLDPRLTFWVQIQHAAGKAAKITSQLSRLMANIGGPSQEKRKLLMSTTISVLLYGAEIWADALKKENRRKVVARVHRTAALRVASAYRTVSGDAILVISGNAPIDLLAYERKKLWELKKSSDNNKSAIQQIRKDTITTWQQRWENESRGRWTARLIKDLDLWTSRKFGEVDFYTTQLLSGHGYFKKYLHRMGKVEEPSCLYNDATEDDAEHTFFECVRWQGERTAVEDLVGPINADNLVSVMLESEANWGIIKKFAAILLRSKKRDLDAGAQM
uniref:Reverse transcriptase domain-containing protein n=1 Tax=Bactrocera tryoni TaxID=59916 RepID=A0A142LX43_BACRY|nr:hypothetical protein [Bactrocera tryoni]